MLHFTSKYIIIQSNTDSQLSEYDPARCALFQISAAQPTKHLRNKSKEVVVIELANKMVEKCSDAAISVAVKLRTKILNKISAIVPDMFHLIAYTISL